MMTKEQKDDLISTICCILFVGSFVAVMGYNSYSLYQYNKAEKQQQELKQKQKQQQHFIQGTNQKQK